MDTKIVYDVFHLTYWDWRIALDLFLGGLGVGAFLSAIILMFQKDNDQLISVKVGAVIGPVAMTAGLLLMLWEMGQPLRIYKTITRFNPTSTLSWGGILQEGFILFSAIFVLLLFLHKNKSLRRKMAIFAGLFALFVACYHAFLLSFVTARPLWNAGAVSIASIIGSITTGIAAVIIITCFFVKGREEVKELSIKLKPLLLVLLFIQTSTYFIWIVTLLNGKADFVNAYHIMMSNFGPLFWGGAVFLGLVFPSVILFVSRIGKRKYNILPVYWVCIPILVGGFIFRYILIMAGQIS